MALYAVEEAVRDLQDLIKNDKEHRGYTDHVSMFIYTLYPKIDKATLITLLSYIFYFLL